jgi:N-acetylglucosamine transport system permease protein
LWLLVVGGGLTIAISIGLAHAMGSTGRLGRALRGTILIPQVIPVVVVAILWMFLYNPQFGLVTSGLRAVGRGDWVRTWLGDPRTALPAVAVAFVWYAMGFYALLFSAGLKALPGEVMEAAELDGTTPWRKFISVSWPMLWSTKRTVYVHLTITVMNVFALVLIMTDGGPDRATETMLTYLYQNAFKNFQFGYATAIAVVNFAVVMGLGGLILFLTRRDPQAARR